MLVFIDESGQPHPKDTSQRPVILAVCIAEQDVRFISGRIYGLKRSLDMQESMEIKAVRLLNRGTFRRIPEKREFVEAFFDLVRNLPVTVFGIVMQRPQTVPPESSILPSQFRFLLERINMYAESCNEMATILFDGDGKSQYGGLSAKFNNYLHRSVEGASYIRITDAPFFVDSNITSGIQIADMAAGVVRLYTENTLFRGTPVGAPFLSAVRRYYDVISSKTVDQQSAEGYARHGLYRMPERELYATAVIGKLEEAEEAEEAD